MQFESNKIFSPKMYRDIDEPVISKGKVVFLQNSCNSSKIIIYDINTRKYKSIIMKDIFCFNVHTDGMRIAFEFSGSKRGIYIFNMDDFKLKEINCIYHYDILGGIWKNHLVLRRGSDVILFDIDSFNEETIASCHHILGPPVVENGNCAWVQKYKEKCCIVLYDIEDRNRLVFTAAGYISKVYIVGSYIIYQSCCENKCSVYTCDISMMKMEKCYESKNWIELYKGIDNTIVWTEKKDCFGKYLFDIWVFNTEDNKLTKVLSDYNNVIIPTVSDKLVMWVDGGMKGDNLYCMQL